MHPKIFEVSRYKLLQHLDFSTKDDKLRAEKACKITIKRMFALTNNKTPHTEHNFMKIEKLNE